MSISALNFVTDGRLLLLSNAGQQWDEGTHYGVLVKNAHTPAVGDTTQTVISANICDSTNYANQDIANKAVTETALSVKLDCDDIDFSNVGVDVQVARYLYIFQGTAGSPAGTDKCIGYIDLNDGGSTDVNVNAAIAINAAGLMSVA